jgi:hypothetical protein
MSFDIAKAFDSVDHRILLRKLNFLGIRGLSFNVLSSFLSSRMQAVKFGEEQSSLENVNLGVPQGSNLGPLLFNLLINDISSLDMNSKLFKYADDLIMISELDKNKLRHNMNSVLNDIRMIMDYYDMNLLKVNLEKSKYMIVGNYAHEELETSLKDFRIIKCHEITYLGFVIDADFKFTAQVDKITRSIGSAVNAIRYLASFLSRDALIRFFHAHIQSHIYYAAFALMRCRSIDVERIQRLQSKALKLIFDLPDLYPTNKLFNKEAKKILPVTGLIFNSLILMTKKCVTNNDGSLPSIKRLRSARRSDLMLAVAKKKILKDDLTHAGCKLFNQLPEYIKAEKHFYPFKMEVRKFLYSRMNSLTKPTQFSTRNFYI